MVGSTVKQILPPEWAPQSGLVLTWPHGHGDWHGVVEYVEPVFVHIAREVSRRQRLLVSCWDEAHRAHVHRRLAAGGCAMDAIRLFRVPSNDVWVRDHGPITVLRGNEPRLLDFRFNGWGNKYHAALDDQVTRRLKEAGAFGRTERKKIDMVLEGGSIEVDGAGSLLTTTHCQLSPHRNPGMSQQALEQAFMAAFGVEQVLWLTEGRLSGDDTDGHIDLLARFCDPQTIAYTQCNDPDDADYRTLFAMEAELHQLRDLAGAPYHLVPLPLPQPQLGRSGRRLPASYANFAIINGAVLVPVYDDPADEPALERLRECFAGREIVAIDCRALLEQAGSLHCATMQLPRGVLADAGSE